MNIFDLVRSQDLVAYWELMSQDRAPYLGEELFPDNKKLGITLKWIKGSAGLPVVLKASAFDTAAVPRKRIGFDKLSADMPFFKESLLIDEELRQELNMVIETGNQVYIDSVLNRVFNDQVSLIEGARAQRERMRMMLLTTGVISFVSNGQVFDFDYAVPDTHKITVGTSWSNPDADIVNDIRTNQTLIEDETGVKPTRAVCSRKTWGYMLKNNIIKKSVFALSNGQATLSDTRLQQFLMDECGIDVVVYTKRFKTEAGGTAPYIEDDIFVLFPEGNLGTTWFGTTPEESDLLSSGVANVTIADTGVAVTTMKKEDPVNVETKVTMITLPSCEAADQIAIIDVTK